MSKALLLLGANLENRKSVLIQAIQMISEKFQLIRSSSWYESPAWGFEGFDFYNLVLEIEFELSPESLLKELLAIEKVLGRTRNVNESYQNRSIDIDILFIDQLIIDMPSLSIPHPKIAERRFVLEPLMEFWSDFNHPVLGQSIEKLYLHCSDSSVVTKLNGGI